MLHIGFPPSDKLGGTWKGRGHSVFPQDRGRKIRHLTKHIAATEAIGTAAAATRPTRRRAPAGGPSKGAGSGALGAARNASTPPSLVAPANVPVVSPTTYGPAGPTATPLALSKADVPNCKLPMALPDGSNSQRNPSEEPALTEPGNVPSAWPVT